MNNPNDATPDEPEADPIQEHIAELLIGLQTLIQFVFGEAEHPTLENRKAEIFASIGNLQATMNSAQSPAVILQMLILILYELSEFLKLRRTLNHKPEIKLKDRLIAYRQLRNSEIEASLHRRLGPK